MYYVGKLQKDGKQFDSCTKGKPFRFRLGASEVIQGWDKGVEGRDHTQQAQRALPCENSEAPDQHVHLCNQI